jgi:hypothetical protein
MSEGSTPQALPPAPRTPEQLHDGVGRLSEDLRAALAWEGLNLLLVAIHDPRTDRVYTAGYREIRQRFLASLGPEMKVDEELPRTSAQPERPSPGAPTGAEVFQ